jgi:hypothetical protein
MWQTHELVRWERHYRESDMVDSSNLGNDIIQRNDSNECLTC